MDLILASFGKYSGKVLEKITHCEEPWQKVREGYGIQEPSNIVMEKEDIKRYFKTVSQNFKIDTLEGLERYIHAKLAEGQVQRTVE